ncbi:hypothetical protein, partial [Salmonella sp. SAL4438]|uniref:hypothetical protein n=1 Tax=Salmonella sp. SAL4438 TaxID=3159893 RepID=UPI00397AD371
MITETSLECPKLQTPNSKLQGNFKLQSSMGRLIAVDSSLGQSLGDSDFFFVSLTPFSTGDFASGANLEGT